MLFAGCGGKAKAPKAAPPPSPEKEVEPIADPEPAAKPAPPPPKMWHAKAELTPAKGSKMKPSTVSFSQTEGDSVQVATDAPIDGLKPGKYHLVIHEGAACGANATKVGAAWGSGGAPLDIDVAKGGAGSIDQADRELALDGEASVVGHTLVLHDDKKGKPGKALACGAITSTGDSDSADAP
jgi:Cu/Zn superoxide dismutase